MSYSFRAQARATTRRRKKRQPLLPEAFSGFLARRLHDALALAWLLGGGGLILALGSYSKDDPSFNTATDAGAGVANFLGKPGAYAADLLLQTLGFAAFFAGLAFACWGLRALRGLALKPLWQRLLLLLPALLALSVALARVPAHGLLLVTPYAGGSVGAVLLDAMGGLAQNWIGSLGHLYVALCAALLGGFALLASLGPGWEDWKAALGSIGGGVAAALSLAGGGFGQANAWYRRHNSQGNRARTGAADADADDDESGYEDEDDDDDEDEDEDYADATDSSGGILRAPARARGRKEARAQDRRIMPKLGGKKTPKIGKRKQETRQAALDFRTARRDEGDWALPPLNVLEEPSGPPADHLDESAIARNAEMLQSVLADFGVTGDIVRVNPGPIVTLYELVPAPGTKASRVIGLSDDIARSMSAISVRVAVVPGKNVIGIELPNATRETVFLRESLSSREYELSKARLPLALGKDIGGQPVVADLAKMPHLLVAGTTGSGKSVAINTMILSLLFRHSPERCRFIMIDPKMLELSVYDGIPHLLSPVVTEAHKAITALKWAVREMEDRYRAMSRLGVRNIEGYNARIVDAQKKGEILMHRVQTGFDPDTGKPIYEDQPIDLRELPYIVVVVDEFADLMLVAGKEVENAIQRLAQMARAAGIHLIMATQRPSVDVITGVIKANFPTRISFQVTSKIDSRTILGEGGAENLLGQGDMLYMAAGGRITRVHGPFVDDSEVEQVVKFLKSQGEPDYVDGLDEEGFSGDGGFSGIAAGADSGDDLYDQAVALVLRERKASTSFIQRHLQIGYNRAARIIEQMEKDGIISHANHVGKREVLLEGMEA